MLEILIGVSVLILITGFSLIFWKLNRSSARRGGDSIDDVNKRLEEMTSAKRVAEEKISWLNEQLQGYAHETQQKESAILELNGQISRKEAEIKAMTEKFTEQKAGIEQLQEKFRIEFKNLANEILEEKTQKFTEQNKTRLEEILKPLGEKIRDFEKKVEETYDKESKERFSLAREIKNLADLNQQISKEASNLTNALKGQSKTQGNWGEIILESILEKSGLMRDREYVVRQSYVNEQGRRLQPDVVVNYPGDRHVVIDSKVSLTAYERFASADLKEEQESALRDHLISIKNHVNELSSKNYQDLYQLKSLDFVMMFMPVEPAYLVAMQGEPSLWNYAYERRVLLISPTNLIAALRMISNLWRVENQNKNAQEIARQSGELLDKLAGFVNDLMDIGTKLDSTRKSYDAAVNKFSTGKGNLVRRAEKIRELGAKSSKELPGQILENADNE
ncbi:MAG: DNA recombination protein RmuC [Bacteroidales bacterium]|nr:DNA recombination protein RmuC [Deltaproteobacteria bacterium]MBL7137365.1 DNA recombination protein RmuC [Bacteroidales bacterium]